MKKITIGVVAHVDAGKTTLHENILYQCGIISQMGRVDHQNAYLDFDNIEKQRGITVYSKEARFRYKGVEFTTLDTPGHIDFSYEMERAMQVLDYAILMISGVDGMQSHTKTIYKLLQHYRVPTFIFVNKMDISEKTKEELLQEIEKFTKLPAINFTNLDDTELENIALTSDELLQEYTKLGTISKDNISKVIHYQMILPTYFGSALKNQGVSELLDGLNNYVQQKQYQAISQGQVFKISHDMDGNRLTHVKILGGSFQVKQKLENDEKIDQIRMYSGLQYETVDEVFAGDVCTIKGLKNFQIGDTIGFDNDNNKTILDSFINYKIEIRNDKEYPDVLKALHTLNDENPNLHMHINNQTKDIEISVMGEVHLEIIKYILTEKYRLDIDFLPGSIPYKETIVNPVYGVGHFEPLRHYAEVVLYMEPLENKNDFIVESIVHGETLSSKHQNQIISLLKANQVPGVLTRNPLTGLKITLIDGRAHQKHTEGGDFKEATYRAVRQGLMQAKSCLLEPMVSFDIEAPTNYVSKVIYEIDIRLGTYQIVSDDGFICKIEGEAPLSKMQEFSKEILILTKGQAKYSSQVQQYKQCSNQDEVIATINYHPLVDIDFPSSSIFCKQGAGFQVEYNRVHEYMHCAFKTKEKEITPVVVKRKQYQSSDEELEDIFYQTYGKKDILRKQNIKNDKILNTTYHKQETYILVDGYNVLHCLEETKHLIQDNIDMARSKLIDILLDYQGYKQCTVVVVFDAYKVVGGIGSNEKYHSLHIVYTKQAQTADMYIEKATGSLVKHYNVQVISDDRLEQTIVMAKGGQKVSVSSFYNEYKYLQQQAKSTIKQNQSKHHYVLDRDSFNQGE